MITPEQHAEIRRLFYAEHWKVGTIATQIGVHHETVAAALNRASVLTRGGRCRATALDPYFPFLRDMLAQYPRLHATRLHEMVRARGCRGSAVQVRRAVRRLRPARPSEAYLRLATLPGEVAQVDWGHFGHLRIGRGTRPLSAFVLVLGHSRALHGVFTLDQTLESFLRGHVEAFATQGGCARTIMYDNLKTAALDRLGSAVHFHPRLLELAGHYHFAPRPCAPARAHEKGKVERPVRYLRDNFVYGRTFLPDADLDQHRQAWLDRVANVCLHGTTRERPRDRFDREERFLLQPLAGHRYTSLVVDRPASSPTRRAPRPMVVVEKRSLATYAQLAGGAR